MGPSKWHESSNLLFRVTILCAKLVGGLLLGSSLLFAQIDRTNSSTSAEVPQGNSTVTVASPNAQPETSQAIGNVSGTVLDATGTPVAGARVIFTREALSPAVETLTEQDGHFSFSNVAPGPFNLNITLAGFKTKTVSGNQHEDKGDLEPAITLELAPIVTDVSVRLTTEEIATEQIKVQEQQRLLAVIPNFYATYVADAVPMSTKQKFGLAWKAAIDPTSFLIAGIIAGGEQASNSFPGYGQGAVGYANRFGAAYGDFFIGTYVSNAILPSLLHQDPRYFYKGTGTIKSRVLWALARSVMARGDNGKWQPDYSGIGGSLASGAISNLYYPEGSRHGFETTLNNTLIGIATGAGVNIMQEFLFRKLTPKKPPVVDPAPTS